MSEIRDVVLWTNNVVMVTDEAGQELPEYHGRLDIMRPKILRDAPATARFYIAERFWQPPRTALEITRESFALHPGFPPTYAR